MDTMNIRDCQGRLLPNLFDIFQVSALEHIKQITFLHK
ncbi:hypothetical protein VL20_4587 [Microcystis panniformis FACHB-1757]|uniref:Uncharacterized protein n=1 Tax=Microcystis panniformis FACHB-1757 TaxID=1638788 RepID=A0A0K1S608_9CHRO|nr:hypothetical protein VL20_4587 [Microcystis panniformis FACHB-1757]